MMREERNGPTKAWPSSIFPLSVLIKESEEPSWVHFRFGSSFLNFHPSSYNKIFLFAFTQWGMRLRKSENLFPLIERQGEILRWHERARTLEMPRVFWVEWELVTSDSMERNIPAFSYYSLMPFFLYWIDFQSLFVQGRVFNGEKRRETEEGVGGRGE